MKKTKMVCLAASWKNHKTCIAGIEVGSEAKGVLIRPVYNCAGDGIPDGRLVATNGARIGVLDIVETQIEQPAPLYHQRENALLAANAEWSIIGAADRASIYAFASEPASLWLNGFHGNNDRIPTPLARSLETSLQLVSVECALLRRVQYPERAQFRIQFRHAGAHYDLTVTDPYIRNIFQPGEDGTQVLPAGIICVSLTDDLNGYCYKLAASIITPERFATKSLCQSFTRSGIPATL